MDTFVSIIEAFVFIVTLYYVCYYFGSFPLTTTIMLCYIIFFGYILLVYQTTYKTYNKVKHSAIPRHIYTYWNNVDKMTPVIQNCIKSWYSLHPFYTIHIITDNNISQYVPIKPTDSYLYNSQLIRLFILEEKGGIWIDPCVYLNQSLDWIHSYQHYEHSEFVCFQKQGEHNMIDPFIMACIPNSSFIKRWKEEYFSCISNSLSDYLSLIKKEGVEFDMLHEPTHLHASAQRILHTGSETLSLISSQGPLSSRWITIYPFLPLLTKEPVLYYNKWSRKLLENIGLTSYLL